MHELEKRALEDPFLADALEGYAQSSTADHGLSILQRQLHERIAHQQENKKVFDLSWQRLSVAAAAAVMFISAGILFWMNSQVPDKTMAVNQKQVEVSVTPVDSVVQDNTLAANAAKKSEEVKSAAENTLENTAKYAARPTVKSTTASIDEKASLNTALIDKPEEDFLADKSARIAANETMGAEQAKASKAVSNDSMQKVMSRVSAQKLSEVSVSSFAPAEPKAYPADGWEAYRKYLRESVQKASELLKQKGKVIILFKVDPDGSLHDLKILQGLSASADSAALQIIRLGPAWKPAADGKVSDLKLDLEF